MSDHGLAAPLSPFAICTRSVNVGHEIRIILRSPVLNLELKSISPEMLHLRIDVCTVCLIRRALHIHRTFNAL
jgi:hypothetical protein